MSKMLRRPWVFPASEHLLYHSTPAEEDPIQFPLFDQYVQIYNVDTINDRVIYVSDKWNTIPCVFSDDCWTHLTKVRAHGVVHRLAGGFLCLKEFRFALSSKFSNALHLVVTSVEYLGGDECNTFGNPKNVNSEPKVLHALSSFSPSQLNFSIRYRQDPTKQWIPVFKPLEGFVTPTPSHKQALADLVKKEFGNTDEQKVVPVEATQSLQQKWTASFGTPPRLKILPSPPTSSGTSRSLSQTSFRSTGDHAAVGCSQFAPTQIESDDDEGGSSKSARGSIMDILSDEDDEKAQSPATGNRKPHEAAMNSITLNRENHAATTSSVNPQRVTGPPSILEEQLILTQQAAAQHGETSATTQTSQQSTVLQTSQQSAVLQTSQQPAALQTSQQPAVTQSNQKPDATQPTSKQPVQQPDAQDETHCRRDASQTINTPAEGSGRPHQHDLTAPSTSRAADPDLQSGITTSCETSTDQLVEKSSTVPDTPLRTKFGTANGGAMSGDESSDTITSVSSNQGNEARRVVARRRPVKTPDSMNSPRRAIVARSDGQSVVSESGGKEVQGSAASDAGRPSDLAPDLTSNQLRFESGVEQQANYDQARADLGLEHPLDLPIAESGNPPNAEPDNPPNAEPGNPPIAELGNPANPKTANQKTETANPKSADKTEDFDWAFAMWG